MNIEQAVKPQGWELAGQGSIPGSYNGVQRRPGQVALFKKKKKEKKTWLIAP